MGLRDTLKATLQPELHGCTPMAVQHATSPQRLQQPAQLPRNAGHVLPVKGCATADATTVQQGSCMALANGTTDATELHDPTWTDADIARFNDRRARLLSWGWPEPEAEALAERLERRDADDDRRTCVECSHFRRRCGNHRRAGQLTPELGRDLAALPQRCPGFDPRLNGSSLGVAKAGDSSPIKTPVLIPQAG